VFCTRALKSGHSLWVVFRFSSFLAWLCCNPIWEIISSFASAHALVISYVTKGQSHRHQNKHLVWAVFLISRSIWIAFHYLTSVDNDLQSKQTVATDKIYSAKPSESRLGAGKLCNFYYYSSSFLFLPCQRQKSSQSTAIEMGVDLELEIESQSKRFCGKKGNDKESPTNQCRPGLKWSKWPHLIGKSPASLPFFGVSAYILHKSIMRFEMQLSHIMALSTTTALLTNQWSLAK